MRFFRKTYQDIKLALLARRALAGKATKKDRTTVNDIIRQTLGPIIRHALTTLSGILTAKSLPPLNENTVVNLTELGIAIAIFAIGLIWSLFDKRRK